MEFMNPAGAPLLAKVRHIIRNHGVAELTRRGVARCLHAVRSTAQAFRTRVASAALVRLPKRIVPVVFPPCDAPTVSIVIPVFNERQCVNACLLVLRRAWGPIPAEVIVVDDASTDDTPSLLQACSGIRVVRRERNGGFATACNSGAAVARGRYLHFLNSDALVTRGWLEPLCERLDRDRDTGAVVSQLRNTDGTIAEAGAIVWSDGQATNYGRGASPGDPRYDGPRDVDYGSAASLMVRADLFAEAGGFAENPDPYYEDADLCFELRARGNRTVYEPRSVVVHLGGVSYGSNRRRDAIASQERSRAAFATKWRQTLAGHQPPDPSKADAAARRLCGRPRVLVVDERVPFDDRSAGAQRIRWIVSLLRERKCDVIFGSMDRRAYAPYAQRLRQEGVLVLCGFGRAAVERLRDAGMRIDAIWLCRPGPAAALGATVREAFPHARLVYDTVDLHYVRLQREEHVLHRPTGWESMRDLELRLARDADRVVVTSDAERAVLEAGGIANASVVPVIQARCSAAPPPWSARSGIVFTGNYSHAPNEDAVAWLCAEIMPAVWQEMPDLRLTIAGADPTLRVERLASERVTVTGFVADLDALLARQRLFVAPLRFGAGIKGKLVQALANGLPIVTTRVGDEGLSLPPECAVVADAAQELARGILLAYGSESLWNAFSRCALAEAERFTPAAVLPALVDLLPSDDVLRE